MKIIISILLSFFLINLADAQKRAWQSVYADKITAEELEEHLEVLASDEFEGRETGKMGQKLAAEYLASFYKSLGLPAVGKNNSYYQEIPLTIQDWQKVSIEANNKTFVFLEDFYCFSKSTENGALRVTDVVFAGYGIDDVLYSDYKNLKTKGKVLMMLDGEPKLKNGTYLLTQNQEPSKWSTKWRTKLATAKQKGAQAVLIIKKNIEQEISNNRHRIKSKSMQLVEKDDKGESYPSTFYISEKMAKRLIGVKYEKHKKKMKRKAAKKRSASQTIKTALNIEVKKDEQDIIGENVFGYIEGSDLKDELIVITAHYDHLGKHDGKIFNGADDNGTGTAALMEIAESFALAKENGRGPRRSILIFNNAAEEKGLLGSKHYTNQPIFPLNKTIACLNIDMIGRLDPTHQAEKDTNYVYIIGSNFLSTDLHKINESANNAYVNLNLDYAYNSYDDPNRFYYRSDHYNFVEKGIPSIFYFSGVHKDYHKHTDTEDQIVYPKVEKITRLVFHTAWELANRNEKIKVDVSSPNR